MKLSESGYPGFRLIYYLRGRLEVAAIQTKPAYAG